VKPIEVSRAIVLSPAALPSACPATTLPITVPDARAATATLAPSGDACVVTVHLDSVVLIDRDTIAAQQQSLGSFDATALVGIDLELLELDLTDESGRSLAGEVRRVAISVDGEPLFDTSTIGPQAEPPRSALPEPAVAAFRSALTTPSDVRADLDLELAFERAAPIPKRLDVRMLLQPILLVDVVRAAL
jgi:hypothetical protein